MKKRMFCILCLSLILSMTACGAKEDTSESLAETYTEESVESQVFVPSPTVVTMRSDDDGPCDVLPIIMVNGKLYSATGEISTVTGRCGNMDGEIKSSTNYMSLPTEDNQSNFGVGYGYQYGFAENTIEVFMNDEWCVFALMEEEPTLVEIIDLTVVKQLSTDSAMEEFFKDEDFTYYFPSIKSEYIECRFSDGATMNVADAINHYKISIADLDTYGIGYWKVDKEGNYINCLEGKSRMENTSNVSYVVKDIVNNLGPVSLSDEESKKVQDFIDGCKYEIGTSECASDFQFTKDDGSVIFYHSECGTFNDVTNNLSYKLLPEQKEWIGTMLAKHLVVVTRTPNQDYQVEETKEVCEGVPLAPEGFTKP